MKSSIHLLLLAVLAVTLSATSIWHLASLFIGCLLTLILLPNSAWEASRGILAKVSSSDEGRGDGYEYGMDHALLNSKPVQTFWLNMGFWKDTDDFVEACEALSRLTIENLRLSANSKVIDYGSGCGDQSLHLLRLHPSIDYTSVTSEPKQARLAASRISSSSPSPSPASSSLEHAIGAPGSVLHIFSGDAGASPKTWIPITPSSSVPSPGTYDAAMSLDSCYHYDTRDAWLVNVHRMLKPGGRLGCTDLVLGEGYGSSSLLTRVKLRVVLRITGSPWCNFVGREEYVARLRSRGFGEVEVEDVSGDVFPGLGRYVRRRKAEMGAAGGWNKFEVAAGMFAWLHREDLVRFVVVGATKEASNR
ncbi:hypothetical protein HKX48_001315 [Thoreauomyces humboldtii]|nr:hypothetical protein HKX48_001315 [Thoreauomyces humboldtii]